MIGYGGIYLLIRNETKLLNLLRRNISDKSLEDGLDSLKEGDNFLNFNKDVFN